VLGLQLADQRLTSDATRSRLEALARVALGRVAADPPSGSPAALPAASAAPSPAAARSSPAPAMAQAGADDPCRVVTKEELEAALGLSLGPGQRAAGECGYKAQADPNPGTMPSVTVTVLRSRQARTTYDYLREQAPARAADVPGLGDKAYVSIGAGLTDFREIQVLRGDVLVSVNLTAIINPPVSMSDEEKRTKLIALARTALGRL
jgi:hypothetical protein